MMDNFQKGDYNLSDNSDNEEEIKVIYDFKYEKHIKKK